MNGMWVASLGERKGLEIGTRSCEVRGWAEGAVFPHVDWESEMEFENILDGKCGITGFFDSSMWNASGMEAKFSTLRRSGPQTRFINVPGLPSRCVERRRKEGEFSIGSKVRQGPKRSE